MMPCPDSFGGCFLETVLCYRRASVVFPGKVPKQVERQRNEAKKKLSIGYNGVLEEIR